MISAETWREMEVKDILSSIDVAIAVLEERDIRDELSMIAYLAAQLNDLLSENLSVLEAHSI